MNILCIDVGGTTIKSGIISRKLLIDKKEIPSNAHLGGEHILSLLFQIIEGYSNKEYSTFDAIGICTTGQVDTITGCIVADNENIPNYKGLDIKKRLEEVFFLPVYLENDVNAAALGESSYGAAKGISSFLCLTYGTGIGAAIMENNQLITGSKGFAGEVGHMVIHGGGLPCNCGYRGCYERYASVTNLVESAIKIDPTYLNGRIIFDQLDKGNLEIKQLVDSWIEEISYGLISLIHIFNPSHILLGGGIMKQNYIIQKLRSQLENSLMDGFEHVTLLQTSLSNDAGMFGMAHICRVKSSNFNQDKEYE